MTRSEREPFARVRRWMAGLWLVVLVGHGVVESAVWAAAGEPVATSAGASEGERVVETEISQSSAIGRALESGPVVFMTLLVLVAFSVMTWAVVIAKYLYLRRTEQGTQAFIKSFWESRSLNELNGRLGEFPYSPAREVFRSGYSELARSNQLREQPTVGQELVVSVAIDNLHRTLGKAKTQERRKSEKYLTLLAITASACPFIGLFGTVWGIMGAFEGIARTGSASLGAVAPGISEALIATAFGLAAAIPAVVGYNIFASTIRSQMAQLEGFAADFLNIVQRYLVSDRSRGHGAASAAPAPSGHGV